MGGKSKTKKTMNTEFKGTKGEWLIEKESSDKSIVDVKCINGDDEDWMTLTIYNYSNSDKKEREFAKANAELIADAGNTIQSCGLLPSELLKQRDELRDFLRIIISSDMTPISYRKTAKKLLESTE